MLKVKVETKEMMAELKDLAERKIPYAVSIALTETAKLMRFDLQTNMRQVFDRPTRYTLNAMEVLPARKDRLEASVWWKWPAGAGPEKHYMMPETYGGGRSRTRTEKMFGKIAGFGGKFFVPAAGAKLDSFGNWSAGERNKVLSYLQLFGEQGYSANQSSRSRLRQVASGKTREYFAITKRTGGLNPGIYQRVQSGVGFGAKTKKSMGAGVYQKGQQVGKYASVVRARGAKPILVPSKSAVKYRPRFPFYQVGQKSFDVNIVEQFRIAAGRVGAWK